MQNRQFIEIIARLNLVLDEIKMLVKDAKYYLIDVQSQINSLAAGKISISTINPLRLRKLLLNIQENAPGYLSLICDPKKDLWMYYRHLKGNAFLRNGKIIIVLSIPMIKKDREYEVYRVMSIAVPPPISINDSQQFNLLATPNLEANGFLTDKTRKNYLLLTDKQTEIYSQVNFHFCDVKNAVYPVSLSHLCIVNLLWEMIYLNFVGRKQQKFVYL